MCTICVHSVYRRTHSVASLPFYPQNFSLIERIAWDCDDNKKKLINLSILLCNSCGWIELLQLFHTTMNTGDLLFHFFFLFYVIAWKCTTWFCSLFLFFAYICFFCVPLSSFVSLFFFSYVSVCANITAGMAFFS